MKIVVLNYTGDRNNWGCQTTSRNLISFLRATFAHIDSCDIKTIPLSTKHPVDKLVEMVHGKRIERIYRKHSPALSDLKFLEGLVKMRFGSFVDMAQQADVLVFQGEGSIGPVNYFRSLRLFALPFLAAHLWKKPVYSINQTLYATMHKHGETLASIFLPFKIVAVREMCSYQFARNVGLSNAVLCPDMAFTEEKYDGPSSLGKPYFCVAGSAAASAFDHQALEKIILRITELTGLEPLFIYSTIKDKGVIDKLFPNHRSFNSTAHPNISDILPVLSAAKFMIGGRYHTAITSLTQGTPVVLLPGNTFKSEGIGPMLDMNIPVYDVSEFDAIEKEVKRIISEGDLLRNRIIEAVDRSNKIIELMSQYIIGLTNNISSFQQNSDPKYSLLTPDVCEVINYGKYHQIYEKQNNNLKRRFKLFAGVALKTCISESMDDGSIERTFR
ncbi:MAG: polysaccharide pyruvyl transferase family protein [Bacteroidetes bacterium]|nr:polysaccharide pyruvyl transferase family protein [Bacteroidota bacterium]